MIEGITALLKNKLTPQTNLLIKDFHDSCLEQTVPEAELVVENLTDGQIWHQMNQHLQKSISKWNRFLNKVTPMIVEQAVDSQNEQAEMEVEEYEGEGDDYDYERE